MRIASYLDGGVADYGVVINDGGADVIVPASATLRDSFPTVRALLEGDAVDALRRDVEARHGAFPVHSVDLTPPIVNPRNPICVGLNYPKIHPTEGVVPPPKHIIIFGKFEGALVGHDAPLIQPRHPASQTHPSVPPRPLNS